MNNNQLVSIIIPTYNRAHLIEETLDSVLAQTYTNWECIIVEDGSNDKTVQVIEIFISKDNRFKLLHRNRDPKGAPTCRNIGLEFAKGDYVIYLDSDDLLAPFCLEQRVNLFKENQLNDFLVFKSLLFVDKPFSNGFYWNIDNEENDLARFIKLDALWQTSGPIYKKEFLIKIGGFKENLLFWQDYDLHLRCLLKKAMYLKFFDLPVDVYIRDGRKDTISRSISFTGNLDILKIRVKFYDELINDYYHSLSTQQKKSLQSVSYYFNAQYVIKHGKFILFFNNWVRINKVIDDKNISLSKSIFLIVLLKISTRFLILRQFVKTFCIKNINVIPDYYILKKSKIGLLKTN